MSGRKRSKEALTKRINGRPAKAQRVTRATAAAGKAAVAPRGDDGISASDRGGTKLVAFLRGVNVSGRVHRMHSISEALRAEGFKNVATFLASGNVLFDAPTTNTGDDYAGLQTVERRVEKLLEELFGNHISVVLRSLEGIRSLQQRIVKPATAVNVSLLKEKLIPSQREALLALSTDADELEPLDSEFVWYSATKMSASPLFKVSFEKKLGVPVTVRNINTLRRLVAKFG